MNSNQKIAIIIPAYNEELVIGDVVKGIIKYCNQNKYMYEVIVVDDGSKDRTALKAKESGATIIKHILNMGSGGATATGLSYACHNNFYIAATMDADGQHLPQDVIKGIELMKKGNKDLIIGSRLMNNNGMSKAKLLGNIGLSWITFMLFGIKVTDSQSGLRVFSKKSLENLHWETSGYEYCSEMIWRANQQKLIIGEYPISTIYTEYSSHKGQSNWNAFNIVSRLIRRRVLELINE